MTATLVYRSKVDFPPMFGPVTKSAIAGSSTVLMLVEFGIKFYFL